MSERGPVSTVSHGLLVIESNGIVAAVLPEDGYIRSLITLAEPEPVWSKQVRQRKSSLQICLGVAARKIA